MRCLPRAFAAVSGLLLATVSSPAFAQAEVDRATARQLGESGEKALEAKDYKTAEDDFRRAETLVHAPTLLLGLARALAGEGKLVEAQETYRRILREGVTPGSPAPFRKAVDDAGKEVDTLSPRIGSVTITIKTAGGEPMPASLQVTWDGEPVNAATLGVKRPANPGSHVVHAAAEGYKPVDVKVDIPVAGAADAPLSLERGPNATSASAAAASPASATAASTAAPAGPEQPAARGTGPGVWPWVAFGVGAAGLVTGGITGVMALSAHSDLSKKCGSGPCPPDQRSNVDTYNTLGAVSTVGFVVAGVGAAAGAALLALQPNLGSPSPAPPSAGLHVRPVLGLGDVGVAGTF